MHAEISDHSRKTTFSQCNYFKYFYIINHPNLSGLLSVPTVLLMLNYMWNKLRENHNSHFFSIRPSFIEEILVVTFIFVFYPDLILFYRFHL